MIVSIDEFKKLIEKGQGDPYEFLRQEFRQLPQAQQEIQIPEIFQWWDGRIAENAKENFIKANRHSMKYQRKLTPAMKPLCDERPLCRQENGLLQKIGTLTSSFEMWNQEALGKICLLYCDP